MTINERGWHYGPPCVMGTWELAPYCRKAVRMLTKISMDADLGYRFEDCSLMSRTRIYAKDWRIIHPIFRASNPPSSPINHFCLASERSERSPVFVKKYPSNFPCNSSALIPSNAIGRPNHSIIVCMTSNRCFDEKPFLISNRSQFSGFFACMARRILSMCPIIKPQPIAWINVLESR